MEWEDQFLEGLCLGIKTLEEEPTRLHEVIIRGWVIISERLKHLTMEFAIEVHLALTLPALLKPAQIPASEPHVG